MVAMTSIPGVHPRNSLEIIASDIDPRQSRRVDFPWHDPPYIVIGVELPRELRYRILETVLLCEKGVKMAEGHRRGFVRWARERDLWLRLIRVGQVASVDLLAEVMGRVEGFCGNGDVGVGEFVGPMVFCGPNGNVGKVGFEVGGSWIRGLGVRLGRTLGRAVVDGKICVGIGWVEGLVKAGDRDLVAKGLVNVEMVNFGVEIGELAVMEVVGGGGFRVLSKHRFGDGPRTWGFFKTCLTTMLAQEVIRQETLEKEREEVEKREEDERKRLEAEAEEDARRDEEEKKEKIKRRAERRKRREEKLERKRRRELKRLEKHRKKQPPSLYNLFTENNTEDTEPL